MDFKEFVNKINSYRQYSQEEIKLIEKAFNLGAEIFSEIKLENGEPYFSHCIGTALSLAKLKQDKSIIIAGLLHDVLEYNNLIEDKLKKEFGEEIAFLIKGVSKLSNLKYKEKNLEQAKNLRNLILAIVKDIRIAIIKLAERLDYMRILEFLPKEERNRIALETADVYVPLANRLGISEWAGELDDLALKFLEPDIFEWLLNEVNKKIAGGKEYLENLKPLIIEEIKKRNIKLIDIQFRIKRISSIYKKLQRKNFDLDQIYDILAYRIIVETIEECYIVLGLIHSLFKPLMHEFDDYISFPKPNGYQSLHTTVVAYEGKFIEFQIRTQEMHYKNEYGVAAYFAYADSKQTKSYKKEIPVFANTEDLKIIENIKDFRENFKEKFFEIISDKIYVLTPKGEIIELPNGSTPLDFAYKIHTNLGHHFVGARVNQKMVPIDYQLQNGDLVEIITNKNSKPSLDWLKIVKTSSARKKIMSFFKKENNYFA